MLMDNSICLRNAHGRSGAGFEQPRNDHPPAILDFTIRMDIGLIGSQKKTMTRRECLLSASMKPYHPRDAVAVGDFRESFLSQFSRVSSARQQNDRTTMLHKYQRGLP